MKKKNYLTDRISICHPTIRYFSMYIELILSLMKYPKISIYNSLPNEFQTYNKNDKIY